MRQYFGTAAFRQNNSEGKTVEFSELSDSLRAGQDEAAI